MNKIVTLHDLELAVEKLIAAHGRNTPVAKISAGYRANETLSPRLEIRNVKVLTRREKFPRLFVEGQDPQSEKGVKIVAIFGSPL